MKKTNDVTSLSRNRLEKIARLRLSKDDRKAVERLMAQPITYIPGEDFRRPAVMAEIMVRTVTIMPGHPLSREDEKTLFLQFNYARHLLCQTRRRLLRQGTWQRQEIEKLLHWHHEQLQYRSQIVTGNIGLVVGMVQRVNYPGVELGDLISEGNMALLRAAERFDCERGFRFSTYACRAIFKSFSRAAKQNYRYCSLFAAQLESTMEKDNHIEERRDEMRREWIDEVRTIVRDNLADLSGVEMSVVKLRFSLDRDSASPLTLKEVGAKLSLTKERIRQIQKKALEKLRVATSERLATV